LVFRKRKMKYSEEDFKSQYGQDKELLNLIGEKQNGFFVELGANDGIFISNSYFFEKCLNWKGVLIEPDPEAFNQLKENRKNSFVSNALCGSKAGIEKEFLLAGVLSGIVDENISYWTKKNINNDKIILITRLLSNVLDEFNCPNKIDFLSLDVEGSEFEILSTFPFDKYEFDYICVEHNACYDNSVNKKKINEILIKNNYIRIRELNIDDIFMHTKLLR